MNRPRLLRSLALFLGYISAARAQPILPLPVSDIDIEKARPWVVMFAPLSLFDPDNTVQFGIERLVGQHQSVQFEFGYGWQGMNLWRSSQNGRYSNREIWRGRAEWRYYINKTNQPQGKYVAIEGLYKQVSVLESGTVGMGCSSGPCQYYQQFSSPLTKYVWGMHIKYGRQFSLLAHNNRLLADVYLGLGFRHRDVKQIQLPDDSEYYYSRGSILFNSFSTTPYVLISVSYGAKIGYSF